MSDIPIQWKKITRGFPKSRKYADDRAPTIEEIQNFVNIQIEELKELCIQWHLQE